MIFFLKVEDMDGKPISIAANHIIAITNNVDNPRVTDDLAYVTTIHTTLGIFRNINASFEQIEEALSGDGVVRF